jgi:hypothetical protein
LPGEETKRRYDRYTDAAGHPSLADSFVFLIDLLGTSASSAADAKEYLRITHAALARAGLWANEVDGDRAVARWFSDNLVLAEPCEDVSGQSHELGFGFSLISAAWVQLEVAMMGLFSRGGLSLAPFFANEQFVYGPALVEAHALESKDAIYPRIVLSPTVATYAVAQLRAFLGGEEEVHRTHLAIDRDGLPFVNYLSTVWDIEGRSMEYLEYHKGHILSRLDQHRGDPHIHLKYEWLADYHDRFCRAEAARGAIHVSMLKDVLIGAVDGDRLPAFGSEVPLPPAEDEELDGTLEEWFSRDATE